MLILVNGLMGHYAGKTSVVRAILQRGLEEGVGFTGFKPMSAHNYWEHFDHSKLCQSLGLLVSRDAVLFQDLSERRPELVLLNPYHQLVCPFDVSKLIESEMTTVEGSKSMVLAERLSSPGSGSTLYINRKADMFVAPPAFLEALRRGADKVETFRLPPGLEGRVDPGRAARASLDVLVDHWENVVIEGYSDVVSPMALRETELDLVLSVGGSLVLLIDPSDVARTMNVVSGQKMIDLLKYVRPKKTIRVPHLSSKERENAATLARAYSEVLNAIWESLP